MTHYYSPHTGELINTNTPSDWMAVTEITPPVFDSAVEGCFFREGAWVIVVSEPPAPQHLACSAWQIRAALNQKGWRQDVETAIAASSNITLKDAWQYNPQFHRNNPLVVNMGLALGKTEAEMNALFELAVTLTLG